MVFGIQLCMVVMEQRKWTQIDVKKNNHLSKRFLWCLSQDLRGYRVALFGDSWQYTYSSWKTMKAVVCKAKGGCRLWKTAQPILLQQGHASPPLPMSFRPANEPCMIPFKGTDPCRVLTGFSFSSFKQTRVITWGPHSKHIWNLCIWVPAPHYLCTGNKKAIELREVGDMGCAAGVLAPQLTGWTVIGHSHSLCSSIIPV